MQVDIAGYLSCMPWAAGMTTACEPDCMAKRVKASLNGYVERGLGLRRPGDTKRNESQCVDSCSRLKRKALPSHVGAYPNLSPVEVKFEATPE